MENINILVNKFVEIKNEAQGKILKEFFDLIDPKLNIHRFSFNCYNYNNCYGLMKDNDGIVKVIQCTKNRILTTPLFQLVTFQQLKDLYNSSTTNIIGYKSTHSVYGLEPGTIFVKFGYIISPIDNIGKCDGWYFPKDKGSERSIPAYFVEKYFEPIYEEKPQLPTILGYKGEINQDKKTVKYGCKKFTYSQILLLRKNQIDFDLDGIEFKEFGVGKVSREQINQVCDIIENLI